MSRQDCGTGVTGRDEFRRGRGGLALRPDRDLAVLPRLVHVMHAKLASLMRRPMMSAMRFLTGLWMSAALAGCTFDPPTRARAEDGCHIGGCGAEVCSDQEGVVSPCIWYDALVCYRDATCARQPGGACGWTPTPELNACLASHSARPGSQP
jgi:hypothetical protein